MKINIAVKIAKYMGDTLKFNHKYLRITENVVPYYSKNL